MFQVPGRTQFDLNWRLFGVDVRVSPWFWLVSALLGWEAMVPRGFQFLILWVLCVFVSILLHEFGHVLVGRVFGSDGYIVKFKNRFRVQFPFHGGSELAVLRRALAWSAR